MPRHMNSGADCILAEVHELTSRIMDDATEEAL